MKIHKLNEEGTWALPKSKKKRLDEGKKFIVKIEKLKKEIYPVFGDDLLFDEFDGAIRRIEELMEIPESEIKESKEEIPVLGDEEVFEFGLKMKDIRRIIILLFGELGYNMDDKNVLKGIQLSVKGIPTKNGVDKFICVDEASGDFEIRIYEDGFVALMTWGGSIVKYDCAKEVYDIISKNMK